MTPESGWIVAVMGRRTGRGALWHACDAPRPIYHSRKRDGRRPIRRTIANEALILLGLLALAAMLPPVSTLAALVALSLAFSAALRLYEAVSGVRLPGRLVLGAAGFAAAALILGERWNGYERFPALDLILHVVSMAVLACVGLALALMPTAGARPRTPLWVLGTLGFGFAMMVGVLWEIMEFALDQGFGMNTQRSGLVDTMWDLIANGVGALIAVLACLRALRTGRAVPPAGLLLEFLAANPVFYGAWSGPYAPPAPAAGAAQRS
jgi:hypothetical protein